MYRHDVVIAAIAFVLGLSVGAVAYASLGPDAEPQAQQKSPAGVVNNGSRGIPTVSGQPLLEANAISPFRQPVKLDLETYEQRLASMEQRWRELQALQSALQQRVQDLENGLASAVTPDQEPGALDEEAVFVPLAVESLEQQQLAMVEAGVPYTVAGEVIEKLSSFDLRNLELRDQAIREGWYKQPRYFEELQELNRERTDLKDLIDTDAYDRYLYLTGASNRTQVNSVMQGSVAAQAGLQSGDIIQSYAGQRIFHYEELQSATAQGQRSELVPVEVRRGDGDFVVWVNRGPLGVRIEMTRLEPQQ